MTDDWGTFRMPRYIRRYTSKEYLNLHKAKYGTHQLNEATLNKILKNQKKIYTSRFNTLNNVKLSYEQINELMSDWVSKDGTIGRQIDGVMQNLLNYQEGTNGITDKVATSGGVAVGDGVTLSNARSAFNTSKANALRSIAGICNGVDKAVNTMIETVAQCGEKNLAFAALAAYGGNEVPSALRQKITNGTTILSQEIVTANSKVIQASAKIGRSLQELQALGKQQGRYKAADFRKQYGEIVGAIQGAVNTLGGVINEVAVAYGINAANSIGQKAIREKDQEIAAQVRAQGGSFSAATVGQETEEGTHKETKDDVEIVWNTNGLTLTFGGSIKLRQGQGFNSNKGANSKSLGVSGFVARTETLASLLKKVDRYVSGVSVTRYATSSIAALEDTNIVPSGSWAILQQHIGALTLVDAMAGLGQAGDFSTLLIVNNRIFSIGDILNKIYDSQDALLTKNAQKPYLVEGMSLGGLRDKVQAESIKKGSEKPKQTKYFTEAYWRNQESRNILNSTKVKITLNLGNLYGSDIFK